MMKTEKSKDLIRREDAISVLIRWLSGEEFGADIIDLINSLPSAKAGKVAYICDGRECDSDCSECFRTTNIEHAKNFIRMGDAYMEQTEDEQVASKLRNPCNPLLTDEVDKCKEKKSKLDLINRQDAIEAVKQAIYNHDSAIMRITSLPSASVEAVEVKADQLPPKVPTEWINDGMVLVPQHDWVEMQKKIEESASVEVGEWIPVSERLPSERGRYLVTYYGSLTGKGIGMMWYGKPSMPNIKVNKRKKYFYESDGEWGDIIYEEVTAWMPLPEPYEGGDDE